MLKMWNRFLKAMEYRSYCLAIHQLRTMGMNNVANEISEFKHNMYKSY